MVGETARKLYNLSWILMLAGLIGTVQYFFGGSDPIALLGALMMLIGLVLSNLLE